MVVRRTSVGGARTILRVVDGALEVRLPGALRPGPVPAVLLLAGRAVDGTGEEELKVEVRPPAVERGVDGRSLVLRRPPAVEQGRRQVDGAKNRRNYDKLVASLTRARPGVERLRPGTALVVALEVPAPDVEVDGGEASRARVTFTLDLDLFPVPLAHAKPVAHFLLPPRAAGKVAPPRPAARAPSARADTRLSDPWPGREAPFLTADERRALFGGCPDAAGAVLREAFERAEGCESLLRTLAACLPAQAGAAPTPPGDVDALEEALDRRVERLGEVAAAVERVLAHLGRARPEQGSPAALGWGAVTEAVDELATLLTRSRRAARETDRAHQVLAG